MLPGASYGSALIEEQESISDTKARADANMYANKKSTETGKVAGADEKDGIHAGPCCVE